MPKYTKKNSGRFSVLLGLLFTLTACGSDDEPPIFGATTGAIGGSHTHGHHPNHTHDHTHDHHPNHTHDHTHDHSSGFFPNTDGASNNDQTDEGGYKWELPPGFPRPKVPADNPMTPQKVELGRHLFYDNRLSANQTQSCETCHLQSRAFTDGKIISIGSTGQTTPRNSMSLANVAYASSLTWANPLQTSLERQSLIPLFSDNPVELGLPSSTLIESRLATVPYYQKAFAEAFPGEPNPISVKNITRSLASFQRTLISGRSPFDLWMYKVDPSQMSPEAIQGFKLFHSEKFECFHCHVGFNLTDHVTYNKKPFDPKPYHNNGLYNIDGKGGFPAPNTGVHEVTEKPEDMGRFKAPTLRNIALTAPYMHDGSIATLEGVLEHYAQGGRLIESGPHAGDGSKSPLKSEFVIGFKMTPEEKTALLAFLHSLTDMNFVNDPKLANPWLKPGN